MLTTLRILRGIVGFIAIWQVIGLLPIFTNWLPNLGSTTGNMWAIAILKLLVLAISGTAYYWLGRIKAKYENADARTSELPAIGIALGDTARVS
jgi:type II secretory pathway component PulF